MLVSFFSFFLLFSFSSQHFFVSRSHYRKQVRQSFDDFPEPGEGEQLAIVQEVRGSNQVLVELADGSSSLVVVPSKFHKVCAVTSADIWGFSHFSFFLSFSFLFFMKGCVLEKG